MFDKIKDFEIRISPFVKKIEKAREEIAKRVIGQHNMVNALLTGLFSNGHILIEGLPGLAKTLTIKTLADITSIEFKRIQFTPDMLPADILGTQIYRPHEGKFEISKGPLFSNLVLADEINRAPAKVQSALLEVMQEKQITLGNQLFKLSDPFLVLATQNPIEQEGTYSLPEAQLDRFMMRVNVDYPTPDEEKLILDRYIESHELPSIEPILNVEEIGGIRDFISHIYIDEKIKRYIVQLVHATREPSEYGLGELINYIAIGASPRATLMLATGAKTMAFMKGKGYVSPLEVKEVMKNVLNHRLKLTFEAEAEGIKVDSVIERILLAVKVP